MKSYLQAVSVEVKGEPTCFQSLQTKARNPLVPDSEALALRLSLCKVTGLFGKVFKLKIRNLQFFATIWRE